MDQCPPKQPNALEQDLQAYYETALNAGDEEREKSPFTQPSRQTKPPGQTGGNSAKQQPV